MGTTYTPPADAEQEPRTVVYLGNRDAIEVLADPDDDHETAAAEERAIRRIRQPLPAGKRCTTVVLAAGLPLLQAAHDITHPERGVWQAHSDADKPAWVASTDPALAQILAAHWGCELRDPEPADTALVQELAELRDPADEEV